MMGHSNKSPQKSPPKKMKNNNKVFPRRGLAYLDHCQADDGGDEESDPGLKDSLG
jgi:hypothetical protein